MTATQITEEDQAKFEATVRECFGFLEDIGQMKFAGVRVAGGRDPRDRSLVARYSRDNLRVDIGWNELEISLVVLLRFERDDLADRERHVYLEPFIEFLTNGETKALVPYVREGMSIKQLESVMDERAMCFVKGRAEVIKALGKKMKCFLQEVASTSSDTIRKYHGWMKQKG